MFDITLTPGIVGLVCEKYQNFSNFDCCFTKDLGHKGQISTGGNKRTVQWGQHPVQTRT